MKSFVLNFVAIICLAIVTACSGVGQDTPDYDDVEGTWYRTHIYSGGTQRMSYTFNSDLTGVWNSEGRVTQVIHFAYYIIGREIHCEGIYINSSGSTSVRSFVLIYDGDYIYAKDNPDDRYGRKEVIQDSTKELEPTEGQIVDLGLSVKWAGWNVGASSPEGYGGYYMWGECVEKSAYNLSTYQYYNKQLGNDISATEYDVARQLWGGKWRMPTAEEVRELVNECRWRELTYNGVRGNAVTGPNGNRIFIPLAGYKIDSKTYAVGEKAYLWSSTANYSEKNRAYRLYSNPSDAYCEIGARSTGYNVRPVMD